MNEQLKQLGLTPLKAGAIGVLLLVLAAVWGPQLVSFGGGSGVPRLANNSEPKPLASLAAESDTRTTSALREETKSSEKAETPSRIPARVYTVFEASSYDPFEVPGWAPQPARRAAAESTASGDTDRLARIAELQETGVAMILVSDSQKVATIGDLVVRLGDEIEGYRVVEISSDGVLLQPTNAAAPKRAPRGL